MKTISDEPPAPKPLRLGVSACLLGDEVRFDGGHKRNEFVLEQLGRFVELVKVCPEVEVGMGVPRETVRLVQLGGEVHLVGAKSGADHTAAMRRWAADRIAALDGEELSGFVLKKDSPSCGFERVRIYPAAGGTPSRDGRGLFADELVRRQPLLPVEDEGRLNDPWLRENFIVRLFAYRRLRELFRSPWKPGELVAFHSREKLLLMAHHRVSYDQLGRLVATVKQHPPGVLAERYRELFMGALTRVPRARQHQNVLLHVAGYFRDRLDDGDRQELHQTIADHAAGLVPLVVPITLIRHHVRRLGIEYLAAQSYLDPHPKELMLRNHV